MSLNSSAAQPPLSPQQQDTGLPAALPPNTPDVANPSEPEQTEPVLANRSATNSSAELADELNQPPTPIVEHSAPEKSDRSSSASLEAESAITDDEITSLKKAAEQGNAEAHFKFVLRYFYGNGVQCDESIAFTWLQKAAELGHLEAPYRLAEMYRKGVGVFKNIVKAAEWFQKAAAVGNVEAQYQLAETYRKGRGVVQDNVKAVEWYLKAAKQGHVYARDGLSNCYKEGQGVEKNLSLAAYWKMKNHAGFFNRYVELDDGNIQLIEFFPQVLQKFPEFKEVGTINLELEEPLNDQLISSIVKFICSNSRIHVLNFSLSDNPNDKFISEVQAGEIAKALKFNTQLTHLDFLENEPFEEIANQIEVLLTQNRDIAELRQYVKDLHIEKTPGFPFDAVKNMADKTIVAYLKSGQTKEATKKAIDELLIIAGMKALENDVKIT